MRVRRLVRVGLGLAALAACRGGEADSAARRTAEPGPRDFNPPVVTNAESPVQYPDRKSVV